MLNAEYFRRHHADRMARGQVHYVMWVVVDPDVELRGANVALAKEALTAEARDGALLVFDLPDTHQPDDAGGAAELMLRMAKIVARCSSCRSPQCAITRLILRRLRRRTGMTTPIRLWRS